MYLESDHSTTPCKGIDIPEFRKFLPVESEILGFRILNLAQKIRNLANDWNPETGKKVERLITE